MSEANLALLPRPIILDTNIVLDVLIFNDTAAEPGPADNSIGFVFDQRRCPDNCHQPGRCNPTAAAAASSAA